MGKFSEYQSKGDSVSLKLIDGKSFTVTAVVDSDYEDNGEVTPGVKLTTKELFEIEGEEFNQFHTTRLIIVKNFGSKDVNGNPKNEKLLEALANGEEIGPIICEKEKGKKYFNLIDANE